MIYSNLGPTSHRFRDTAIDSLKFPLKIAVKQLQTEPWLLLTAYRKSPTPYPTVTSPIP